MSLLTDDYFLLYRQRFDMDDTTPAYIRYLLEPLEATLKTIDGTNVDKAKDHWIKQNFPERISSPAIQSGAAAVMAQVRATEDAVDLDEAFIYGVLDYMARLLMDQTEDFVMDKDSNKAMVPWDVRAAISENPYLNEIFTEIPDGVPIEVTINGQTFVHHMSYELAAGIANFYYFSQIANPPLITVRGTPLRENFNLSFDETDNTEYYKAAGRYELTFVGPYEILFNKLEYLQGLQTAAQWAGVDLHSYVESLYHHDKETGKTTALSF